jgi:ornithine cyclodeaminase/alanine dehydrogenase-like protein (mu-crystallin family)
MSVLLLKATDIAELAPSYPDIVALAEDTYRMQAQGQVSVPPKIGVHPDGTPQTFLHAMPAWVAGARALGMKWVSFFPGNAARNVPDSTGIIVLNDPDTGLPVAIMEGMWITYARTGACAAYAARALSKPAPRRLGLVGCGGLGRWSLRMIGAVLPSVEEVVVASKRRETREAFCASMAAEGPWRLTPVDEVREAVEGMDLIVSSVPKLREHPVKEPWWASGSVMIPLDVTGAWGDDIYTRADRIVCDGNENLARALERYRPNLAVDPARTIGLQEVANGRAGRAHASERILAFVTGIASLDMTLAWEIYRRALRERRGFAFDITA